MVLEEVDMRSVLLALLLVACSTQVNAPPAEYNIPGHEIIEYNYEDADIGYWPAAMEFCERHVKAAKTKPEYMVDICVIECIKNPDQSWCPDLKEIDDTRRDTPSTN